MFFKIGILKYLGDFTGKHLCLSLFLIKLRPEGMQLYWIETPTQVFSCEIYEIFKNNFFCRTPPVAGSADNGTA